MKALISTAVEENRIISVEEMEARKKLGVGIGCVTLALCAAYPPYRSMYGLLGVGVSQSILLWNTGKQGLDGCVTNLQWNIAGKSGEYQDPPPMYLNFVK